METVKKYITDFKPGDFILINGEPHQLLSIGFSDLYVHKNSEQPIVNIVAEDVFTKFKIETSCLAHEETDVPIVKETEYTLIDVLPDRSVCLMNDKGEIKENVKLPDNAFFADMNKEIIEIVEKGEKSCIVTVVSAFNIEEITKYRVSELN